MTDTGDAVIAVKVCLMMHPSAHIVAHAKNAEDASLAPPTIVHIAAIMPREAGVVTDA